MRMDRRSFLLLGGAGLAGAAILGTRGEAHGEARAIPPPELEVGTVATSEVAVLAGGCFWGVQGVYQHTEGVTSAVSGYAGGERATANYETVGRGQSGHAEAVEITFDPRVIGYGGLLQIFFSVGMTRRSPQAGAGCRPQYRSAIFPPMRGRPGWRAPMSGSSIARGLPRGVVTRIEPDRPFYRAEDYHQDFMTKHSEAPYIVINDLPKIEALRRLFPDRYPRGAGARRGSLET